MKVKQSYSDWASWPGDVQDRLQEWNRNFLLSFVHSGDFICDGCGRSIEGHPNGNPVVRPGKKSHGSHRCEECLIGMARLYAVPPAGLTLYAHDLESKYLRHLEKIESKNARLRLQIDLGELYIEELEEYVPKEALKEIRDRLRGRFTRKQQQEQGRNNA